jgi:hypothetical protein
VTEDTVFEDLYDIERRPGAGAALWTAAVERQFERVREANYRHRLHHSPNEDEQSDDPDAERQLHADVYFLALAIRRVLLFHDLLAKQVTDPRLTAAREAFNKEAPDATTLRNFYEHLDEYLLDSPRKHVKIPGRAAPVLMSRWDSDNVIVAFGPLRTDVTLAAVAAIELGKASAAVWDEHLDRVKQEERSAEAAADTFDQPMMEVTLGVSSIIGGDDESTQLHIGTPLGVRLREATPEERAESEDEPG